ncbi:MAG: HAMP domain-containing histidine kinase, partial [Chloroflexia bacterium]|nr:HAMP domain-containing histidine kinase [Chloroflexia bacterium]
GGTGLGLAIVKAISEMHGGNVSASSAGKGHGTTCTVTLPINVPAQPIQIQAHQAQT